MQTLWGVCVHEKVLTTTNDSGITRATQATTVSH